MSFRRHCMEGWCRILFDIGGERARSDALVDARVEVRAIDWLRSALRLEPESAFPVLKY